MSQTRRLAAILAADVMGYSRLIGTDEEGTLNRLRSIRAELIDPKIIEHRAALSKRLVMAYWSNFRVWSMHYVVRPNGNAPWPRIMLRSPLRHASNFGSAYTRAISS